MPQNALPWVHHVFLSEELYDLADLGLRVVKIGFGSEPMSDDSVVVVYSSGCIFIRDRANIPFAHVTEKLDLPLFPVLRDSSEARAPFASRVLNLVFAPKYYSVIRNVQFLNFS